MRRVVLINLNRLLLFLLYFEIRKKPDTIKKNGTATLAEILVKIKSAVSFTDKRGDVCIAITSSAAISRNLSILVYEESLFIKIPPKN